MDEGLIPMGAVSMDLNRVVVQTKNDSGHEEVHLYDKMNGCIQFAATTCQAANASTLKFAVVKHRKL